jgi:hypothetical protein
MITFFFGYGQSDSLKVSCEAYYQTKAEAEIEEYKQLKKYKFLRFLPSLGYSILRSDFVVSLNTNGAISYLENKQIRNNKISSIILQNNLLLSSALREIAMKQSELEKVITQKKNIHKLVELEKQIFKIKKRQYENAELEPLLYLQAQKTLINQEQKLEDINYKVFQINQQLLSIAKWNF